MHKQRFHLCNYIYDLIGCDEPSVANKAFVFLKQLLIDFGLTITIEKLYEPQVMVPCLGINSTTGELVIAPVKLQDIIVPLIEIVFFRLYPL